MDFFLFLLLNGILFLRPAELLPVLSTIPFYEILIITNLLVAFPKLMKLDDLPRSASMLLLLGTFLSICLSHLARFDLWNFRSASLAFSKILLYFLLLWVSVDNIHRFRLFLACVVTLLSLSTGLSLAHYNGYIDVPSLQAIAETVDIDEVTGEAYITMRLRATGVFNDPNDLAAIICVGLVVAMSTLLDPKAGIVRIIAVLAIALLGYAIVLTQSRSGLLSLAVGVLALIGCKLGTKWMLTIAISAAPLPILLGMRGRQFDFGGAMESGSGAGRLGIWSEWLVGFLQSPLVGVGAHAGPDAINGYEAHNTYLHAFGELGLCGGFCFVGLVYTCFAATARVRKQCIETSESTVMHLAACVIGIMSSYFFMLLTLSRLYVVPTYLVLGIAVAFERISCKRLGIPVMAVDGALASRLAIATFGALVAIYVAVRLGN